jgi:cytochrome c2
MARSNPENQIAELTEALTELAYAISPSYKYDSGTMKLGEGIDWDFDSMETYFQEPMRKAHKALTDD